MFVNYYMKKWHKFHTLMLSLEHYLTDTKLNYMWAVCFESEVSPLSKIETKHATLLWDIWHISNLSNNAWGWQDIFLINKFMYINTYK